MSLPPRTPACGAWLALACLVLSVWSPAARAAEQWAVLIGVQEHEMTEYNLRYPARDVAAIGRYSSHEPGWTPSIFCG
jgi:hypothetical protein